LPKWRFGIAGPRQLAGETARSGVVRFQEDWMKRVLSLCVAMMLAMAASVVTAAFHLYRIEQIYSNADGTVQFIVLNSCCDGEDKWANRNLISGGPGPIKWFPFPTNLPSRETGGRRVLVATEGFAALGIVAPDYVIPNGFLQIPSGFIDFADVSQVAYSGLPSDGVKAIDAAGAPIQNVATNFAGASASVVPKVSPPAGALSFQGLFYNAPAESEAGWGINFAHQGDVIFAAWFTYDATGRAWWLTMTAEKTGTNTYAGKLYETRGPAFNAVPFSSSLVQVIEVGDGTLTFSDVNNGTFRYKVNGIEQTKTLVRQVFGTVPVCTWGAQSNLALAGNFQDLWWAAPAGVESGWGVNFTHQGDIIFATWFTYDFDGKPLWLSATVRKGAAGVYTGAIYRTTGPAFSAQPWNKATVTLAQVGDLTITFANGNAATFHYTLSLGTPPVAVDQTKSIARQVFRVPGTVCQ
jgi:hypothetical protein